MLWDSYGLDNLIIGEKEMPLKEEYRFCNCCVFPSNLGIIHPITREELKFSNETTEIICEICEEFKNNFPNRQHFEQELEGYFQTHRKILFAYSGGLDSTIVLAKLANECKHRGIHLQLFTVITGVKGKKTYENIKNIVSYLGLGKEHFFVDITDSLQYEKCIIGVTGIPISTFEVYRKCNELNILACGKICNTMLDSAYREVMETEGVTELFTGGDTPKINHKGVYSLFWKKNSGITIVRGGYAFDLSKEKSRDFLKINKLPWNYSGCGGYDTDCLVPGVFFLNQLRGKTEISIEKSVKNYPIILEYLAERVRFGIIDRSEALCLLTNIDVANRECYNELEKIFNDRRLK